MKEEVEFVYSRSKSIIKNNWNGEELFLFAGLSKTYRNPADPTKVKVRACVSELIEVAVGDSNPDYLTLPEQDFNATIDQVEYERLQLLFEVDPKSFMMYKPTEKESLKLEMNLYLKQAMK